MKKISILATCIIIVFAVLLTGCKDTKTGIKTDTKSDTKDTLKDDIKGNQPNIETKIGSKEGVEIDPEEVQYRLEKFMYDFNPYEAFSGSILIAKDEKVVFKSGYGLADYDNKISNTPQTVFEIGEITNQFTAAAILMLKEKGLLSINDTINKYIPDYPSGDKIKIFNLLNHTSGIGEYIQSVGSTEAGKHIYTPTELIKLFKDKPLSFEPGISFEYSYSNYILLGYIIEKVSGTSYEEYLKNNIFIPLKMNHTGVLNSKNTVKDMAIGYSELTDKSAIKSALYEPSTIYSAGAMYSNVEDLLIWNNSLSSGKLIGESSLKEMFTPYMRNYAFGWRVGKINGDDLLYHTGGSPGFSSYIARDLGKGYTAIVLSNKRIIDKSSYAIGEYLLKVVDEK